VFIQKWHSDSFILQLANSEKERRERGGTVNTGELTNWFRAETYGAIGDYSEYVGGGGELQTVDASSRQGGEYAVGVLLPLSGQYASYGESIKRGIQLALEVSPNKHVKVEFADTENDMTVAKREYQRLVNEERITAILGPLLAKTSEAVAELSLGQREIPIISFSKKKGLNSLSQNMFRMGITADNQIEELVSWGVKEKGFNRFGIAVADSSSSEEFIPSAREVFSKLALPEPIIVRYNPNDAVSIANTVGALKSANVDAVILPGEPQEALPVIASLKGGQGRVAILATASLSDPIVIRANSGILEGVYYVSPFFVQSKRKVVEDFVTAYRASFGDVPDILAAQGFDAMQTVMTASGHQGNGMKNALFSVSNQDGVTGNITVTLDRDIVRKMSIIEIKNGVGEEVSSAGIPGVM